MKTLQGRIHAMDENTACFGRSVRYTCKMFVKSTSGLLGNLWVGLESSGPVTKDSAGNEIIASKAFGV